MEAVGIHVGGVTVHTSNHGGHSAEFFAETLVNRLVYVADTAPEPIKAQALHYKDSMHKLILDTIRRAMASAELNRRT